MLCHTKATQGTQLYLSPHALVKYVELVNMVFSRCVLYLVHIFFTCSRTVMFTLYMLLCCYTFNHIYKYDLFLFLILIN